MQTQSKIFLLVATLVFADMPMALAEETVRSVSNINTKPLVSCDNDYPVGKSYSSAFQNCQEQPVVLPPVAPVQPDKAVKQAPHMGSAKPMCDKGCGCGRINKAKPH